MMKAVVLNKTCKPDDLKVIEVEIPDIKKDWVLIKVLGFGINRSEVILRDSEADEEYISLPVIPGIECTGEIINPSNSHFKKGDKVCALMGGMGRSFNGSYAEYVLMPAKNVFKINDDVFNKLSLEEIIAIPETYFTAYGSIESLKLKKEDTLLIRGATSATGITTIQLAKALGSKVIATSRSENKFVLLKENGADECVIDDGQLAGKIKCDKVLELIGPKTVNDSLETLNDGGICCITGVLGGIEFMDNFNPIVSLYNKYLTGFYSNFPTQKLMDNIFDFMINHNIKPCIAKVFNDLADIGEAHKLMESNNAQGKIIFKLG